MKSLIKIGLLAGLFCRPLLANDEVKIGLSIRNFGQTKKVLLAPCPTSPNCVTSIQYPGADKERFMEPFKGRSKEISRSKIKFILSQDDAEIIKETDDYLHATYTSSVFKFVDDVEFFFPTDKVIHFRSASRVGHSDLGVNKRRMTRIKKRFQKGKN